jgi:hypothetical protein
VLGWKLVCILLIIENTTRMSHLKTVVLRWVPSDTCATLCTLTLASVAVCFRFCVGNSPWRNLQLQPGCNSTALPTTLYNLLFICQAFWLPIRELSHIVQWQSHFDTVCSMYLDWSIHSWHQSIYIWHTIM